mgnify:CR=1 FL=1
MADPIIVDNTILAAMQTCDTLAATAYVLGQSMFEEAGPLVCGSAIHTALETWFKSGHDTEQAMQALETAFKPWADEHATSDRDRFQYTNVAAIMRQWFVTHPPAALPFKTDPALIEVGFALPLADDVIFVGRMDALVWDAQGAWWIVDHKSTYRLDDTWRKTQRASAQYTGYLWAGQQHLNQPVVGVYGNGIEVSLLPSDPVRKCRDHGVKYIECGPLHARFELLLTQRTPAQIEQWKMSALVLARKFAALKAQVRSLDDLAPVPLTGQFTGACARCQFYDWCRVGRQVEMVPALMRYEPWEPYARVFGTPTP